MATDYISREAALACFADWIDRYGHEHSADEMIEYQRIEELPVADVRPVVRGKWLDTETGGIKETVCSICFHTGWHHFNYCPNCGADMRGETDAE